MIFQSKSCCYCRSLIYRSWVFSSKKKKKKFHPPCLWFDCWPFWGTVIWNSINFKFLLGNLVLIIDSIENLGTIPQYHLWFIVAKPILFFNALFYAFGPIGGCQLLVQTLHLFHLWNDRLCLRHYANLLSCAFVNLCLAALPTFLSFQTLLFYYYYYCALI